MSEKNPESVAAHFKVFATNTVAWSQIFESQLAQQLGTNPSKDQIFLARKIAETLTLIYLQDAEDPKHWQSLISYAYTGIATALTKADNTPPEENGPSQPEEGAESNG